MFPGKLQPSVGYIYYCWFPPRYHLFMKYGSVAIVTGLKYHQGYNILKMTLASRLHYRVKSFIVNFV